MEDNNKLKSYIQEACKYLHFLGNENREIDYLSQQDIKKVRKYLNMALNMLNEGQLHQIWHDISVIPEANHRVIFDRGQFDPITYYFNSYELKEWEECIPRKSRRWAYYDDLFELK